MRGATAFNLSTGITITNRGNFRTVGHEIGHGCGLQDIYVSKPSKTTKTVKGFLTKTRVPKDWNNGPEPYFYKVKLKQSQLVKRLLMFGNVSTTKADIPSGKIYGLYYTRNTVGRKIWHLGNAKVGLTNVNRQPTHQ